MADPYASTPGGNEGIDFEGGEYVRSLRPITGRRVAGQHWDATAHPEADDAYFAEPEADIDVADLLLAMEHLTERQRFVVECRFGLRAGAEGQALGTREIARLMGIDHAAVVRHEQAGLAKLRGLLGDNNPSS